MRRLLSPRTPTADAALQERLPSEPWVLDRITLGRSGDEVTVDIEGWAFPDASAGAHSIGRFLVNGRPFDEVTFPIDRPDVGEVFWQRKNARHSGFRCKAAGAYKSMYTPDGMELTYVNPGPPRRVSAQQSWFIADPAREPEIPDETRRHRVIGNRDLTGFMLTGFTDYRRLDAAAAGVAGSGFGGYRRILDWGCGCGRLSRYTARLPNVELTGCDIDDDNVRWCADHLAGHYVASDLRPPLPFADESFDLVYGLSVFTHLREELQDLWLAELHRVAGAGALLLMTVHGETALNYAGLSPHDHASLSQRIAVRGLHVSGSNSQIDSYADHRGEYVNVFHSAAYVRERWGRHFDILALLPGYIYTHDLVVMQRRWN